MNIFYAYIDPGTGFTIFGLGTWLFAFFFGFFGMFLLFLKKIFKFLKGYKKKVKFIICIITVFILAFTGAVSMGKKAIGFNKKVIILGFDGLSPKIIGPMMDKGELPNLLRLKKQGDYKSLLTTNPPQSAVAWAGFATGQNPGKNGIFDFIIRDPRKYGLSLSLSNSIKGRPKRAIRSRCFWEYASEKKVPNIIISCPVTFPPHKIYGRMLSGMGVPDILGTQGTFTYYTTESMDKLMSDIGGKVFKIKKTPMMIMHLIGPRVASIYGKAENKKIPFKVIPKDQNTIIVEYQKNKFELKVEQWSRWQEVVFNIGLFKTMKGIFKFYLIEAEPEFKLYISPINFDPRRPFFLISYPGYYSKELADNIGLYYTQGMPMDTWAVNEQRLLEEPFLEQVQEVLREKKAILDFELTRFKKGIIFCYFESPDIIQHMFWRYTDPQHPLYEKNAPQKYKEIIEKWYIKMDDVVGRVLDSANENDTLIVLSDHGFDTFRRVVHINSWLRKNGYLELNNPRAESGRELLKDINWSKTRAYAIGFGAIYINQEGRERDGIVRPGRETQLLKEELQMKLSKWIDEKYNKPVVNRVYLKEDIFWGDYAEEAPDIYIGFNIGYCASWQTALGGVPKELIGDNLKKWSGSHMFDPDLIPGVIFCNKKITKENPSIYDIVPTILRSIGYRNEQIKVLNFDGEPLF